MSESSKPTQAIDAILAQRAELKRRDPDAILLFRVEDEHGDLYRAYSGDAWMLYHPDFSGIDLSPIKMTARRLGSNAGWCGFASADLDAVLARIVAAGKRVAVCEPVAGPAPAGAEVERVATPGEGEPGFTPGPWAIHRFAGHRSIEQEDRGDGRMIVVVDHVQSEADARLIAAAPDLLAALKIAIPILLMSGSHYAHDHALAAVARAESRD